jgi:hypothetical protein
LIDERFSLVSRNATQMSSVAILTSGPRPSEARAAAARHNNEAPRQSAQITRGRFRTFAVAVFFAHQSDTALSALCATAGMSFAVRSTVKGGSNMSTDPQRRDSAINPAPSTPSDEDIERAQAIREALRKLLLNRPEEDAGAYWAISAD